MSQTYLTDQGLQSLQYELQFVKVEIEHTYVSVIAFVQSQQSVVVKMWLYFVAPRELFQLLLIFKNPYKEDFKNIAMYCIYSKIKTEN